jgi:sugar transferase (PEP-CTERM/EpsH1 system associated)
VKVLFVVPYVPSTIRVRPYNFIKELAQHHDVTVVATATAREAAGAAGLEELGARVELVPIRPATALMSCAAAALRGDPLQAAVCMSPALDRRLRELVATGGFDVVHVEHLRGAAARASIPAHIPTVFDAVDSISLLWERTLAASTSLRQHVLARLELQRTRRFEGLIVRRFDRVAVTSAVDAKRLQELAPGAELTVVPNGVDLEYFSVQGCAREPATLVFSGKMSYHANVTAVRHFVDAILPLVRQQRPDVQLRIVGSSPPQEIVDLARDPAISVTGYLPDIREAIRGATVAICPVTVKVGVQNKVLEAMALGLPVVCSAVGFEGLAAEPDQDLLVANSPSEFAADVVRLLDDADLRRRLSAAGRRYVESHHRWSAATAQLEGLYQEAIDRHRVPA